MPGPSQQPVALQRGNVSDVLTNLAIAWKHPMGVAEHLMPFVSVPERGGTVMKFGRESFRHSPEELRRARGSRYLSQQFGLEAVSYALHQYALQGVVDEESMEEARRYPANDPQARAVQGVMHSISLARERVVAALATATASYASGHSISLTGNSLWSNYAAGGGSDPFKDLSDACEVIRGAIGMDPNTLIISASVWAKLRRHPKVLSELSDNRNQMVTLRDFAEIAEIPNVYKAGSVYLNRGDADNASMRDVWDKSCVLAYVAPPGIRDAAMPSFAYTLRLMGYPQVKEPFFDRDNDSWKINTKDEFAPMIFTQTAGYLFKVAVA